MHKRVAATGVATLVGVLIAALAWAGAGDADYTAGLASAKARDNVAAQASFEKCIAAEPNRTDCRWELGWVYFARADWQGAIDSWSAVKKIDPSYPQVDKYITAATENRDAKARLKDLLASPPPAPRAALPAGTQVRIRAVGDLMIGTTFPAPGFLPPDDGATEFSAVRSLLQDADVTFGNLEGPLCDHGETNKCAEGSTSCYAFRSPTRYGSIYKDVGFDLLSTANNHSGDFGEVCRRETEATLDKAGIAWSGAPGSIATIDFKGIKIGMVGFHTSPATNDVNDLETAKGLVTLASRTHDLVIVSFHGGAEGSKATHVKKGHEMFLGEDRGDLPKFAHTMIDAGADLVLGHGPHVLRANEMYNGHLIVYSMGNFATYGRFNLSGAMGVSAIWDITLDQDGKLVSGNILPMRQVGEGVPEPDPDHTAITTVRQLSLEDFPDTMPKIGEDGSIRP